MPKGTRRTPQEILILVGKVKEMIAGGSKVQDALTKYDIVESVWHKYKDKTIVSKHGEHGKVDVRTLPPKPKKNKRGGWKTPKPVDMSDIGSVAQRIAKLDKKLRDIDEMVRERIDLVAVLVKLLKVKK